MKFTANTDNRPNHSSLLEWLLFEMVVSLTKLNIPAQRGHLAKMLGVSTSVVDRHLRPLVSSEIVTRMTTASGEIAYVKTDGNELATATADITADITVPGEEEPVDEIKDENQDV